MQFAQWQTQLANRFYFNRKRTQVAEPLFRKPLAKTFVHAKTWARRVYYISPHLISGTRGNVSHPE
ncbi:hypothetical protein RvY_01376 [Ramazzottius varieornatus]|uniref:Uncharacterized protein n=1 Tax=Ramazzottius varieornatus TaxID=947166 RepID=A0A1D1URB0_RAMVA|nr:hypothetical protein RvY_01376 [Ramazzottius varieornatus]